jgi:hypothetical protein
MHTVQPSSVLHLPMLKLTVRVSGGHIESGLRMVLGQG